MADFIASNGYATRERFLYESVAGELRRRIGAGVLSPGTRIESHKDLARQFRVSAITVRRAIRDLILEGLLVSHQGVGVFVSDQRRITRSLSAASTIPFADEIRKSGIEPGLRQLSLTVIRPPSEVARKLRLRSKVYVYRHEKLILGDGEPISREVTFLPLQIGKDLERELPASFVFTLLNQHGIEIDHIDFLVEGLGASDSDAQLLQLAVGFPLLAVHYVLVGKNNSRVAAGSIISRSDRLSFELRSRPEGASERRHFLAEPRQLPEQRRA
jgi:DNA-binding GntR family transcriptional regulator